MDPWTSGKLALAVGLAAAFASSISSGAFGQVEESWKATYAGAVWDITVDGGGNTYVAGRTFEEPGAVGNDLYTVKYDERGKLLWEARYHETCTGTFGYPETVVAAEDSVYVSGYTCDAQGKLSVTVILKYAADGAELSRAFHRPGGNGGWPVDMSLSPDGLRVLCTSSTRTFPVIDRDFALLKCDPEGEMIWDASYDGGVGNNDMAVALAVDDAGNAYATGYSPRWPGDDPIDEDWATVKYDESGNQLWVSRYDGPGAAGGNNFDFDRPAAIALDPEGNVIVTGRSWGGWGDQGGTQEDLATLKYDPQGNGLWARQYDSPGSPSDEGVAVAVDGSGCIHVTGNSALRDGGDPPEIVTIKYDPRGSELWVARYEAADTSEDLRAKGIVLDDRGAVYVAGVYGDASQCLLLKYDPEGHELFARRYAERALSSNGPVWLQRDEAGTVHLLGWDGENVFAYKFRLETIFVRGDADSTGKIDITDGIGILLWLFLGGTPPGCLDAADVDDSGAVQITDAVCTFSWLFTGGAPPPAPSPAGSDYARGDCGADPTADPGGDLGCAVPSGTCR